MKRAAFTFVELMVVITILGIMTTLVMIDFRGAQQRQSADLLVTQVHAALQSAQVKVQAGRIEGEDFICEGLFLNLSDLPQRASGIFDVESSTCVNLKLEDLGFQLGESSPLESIAVAGQGLSSAWILFAPPNGDVLSLNEKKEALSGEIILEWEKRRLRVSDLTDQIYFEPARDEK